MKPVKVRVAVRNWDHLTPLLLGDVSDSGMELEIVREPLTPDLHTREDLDAGEVSLSRMVLEYARGNRDLIALPALVFSSFRHRCILVRDDSTFDDLSDLKGCRIGTTGWHHSGNIWTRSLARAASVDISDAEWVVGPLTAHEEPSGRLGPYGHPPNVTEVPPGQTLTGLLLDGSLDALMSPRMPDGFFEIGSPFRRLLPDYIEAEIEDFRQKGFVPAIHLIGVKSGVVEDNPEILDRLVSLFSRSYDFWRDQRLRALDTTPWILSDFERMATTLGINWTPYRPPYIRPMLEFFAQELYEQGLCSGVPDTATMLSDFNRYSDFPI